MNRIIRLLGSATATSLMILLMTACTSQVTPPGGHSISGTIEGKAAYLLLHWSEGLRIMIVDDLPHGAHHNGSSTSTGDPVFHMDGGAQGSDGQGYEYVLESRDGVEGNFRIDDQTYELNRGKLFLVRTSGGDTRVEQLDINLSALVTSNAGIEAFGLQLPEIVAFSNAIEPPPVPTSTEPAAQGSSTGIPDLDQVIAVILSNDRDARRSMVRLSTAGCVFMTTLTGPPKCTEGMTEGTPLEYFPFRLLPGQSQPIPAEHIDPTLDLDVTTLYAAYREKPVPGLEENSAGDAYGLIFQAGDESGWRIYALFHIDPEGQIVQLDEFACRLDEDGRIIREELLQCPPGLIIERDALEVLVRPPLESIAPAAVVEPPEALVTVPPRMTPISSPVAAGFLPQLGRPIYFLTSELPISSVRGTGHGLWVLELGSPEMKRITPEDQHVTAVDMQQDGGRIAYGTGDGAIYLLEPDGQSQLIYTHPPGDQGVLPSIGSLSWSPDGEWLAFTAAYQDDAQDSADGGLWLLSLEDESVSQLIHNRPLKPGETDVSVVRQIIDVDYSPDGSGLLLQSSYWEYVDTIWLWPLGAGSAEGSLHDSERLWRDGTWAADGQSILLSGWDMAAYSDLARVDVESGLLTRLVDGEAAGLLISNAQALPAGIVFVGAGNDPANGATKTRLYLADQSAGGDSTFSPVGPDRDLCSGGYVMDIAWDPAGSLAVVSCVDGAELISLDGSSYVDLTPILESIPGNNSFEVMWGSR